MDPQPTSLQRLHNVEKMLGDAALTFSFSLCRCCFLFLFRWGAGFDWRRHQRIVRVLDLAGSVMDELASSTGPRADVLAAYCRDFMQFIKVTFTLLSLSLSLPPTPRGNVFVLLIPTLQAGKIIVNDLYAMCRNPTFYKVDRMFLEQEIQTTLREEIKSACEYRPFEKCDYSARISNEICSKKLEYIIEQLDDIKESIN
ncbi:hypothetical protein BHM03_00013356 [Ensete ventricosum]|nr:hypothetical protein BHM03_00013356 [Ensete ventricosum]